MSCAVELALGKPTTKHIQYTLNRVRMLMHFGVTPYLVFDGDFLPSKAGTEQHRQSRREESKKLGMELLNLGRTAQAYKELQKAVDITPEMAGILIEELKRWDVPYVVAPYEADSQLVYLEQKGIIEGILSEDSDLLVFGARRLLTKLDQYGECVMVQRDDFTACREVSFVGWTDKDFRHMAILSGCDYLENLPKMGLKTAHSLLRKYKTLDRVLHAVRFEGKIKIPPSYLAAFFQAENTFLYQWVYCPVEKTLVNLSKPGSEINLDEMPYIGQHIGPKVATGVARGFLHPQTKKPLKLPQLDMKQIPPPSLRKNQTQSSLDTKKHKPIDSFFKAKRTPLAELDPNSFIMTPQQELLARRASNTSWSSPLAPFNENNLPRTGPRTAPAVSESSISHPVDIDTPSMARAKRQRLCHDDAAAPVTPVVHVMGGRSKFFSSSAKSKKRRPSPEFGIFSDDDIEEALLALPDPSQSALPENKQVELDEDDDSQLTLVAQSPEAVKEATLDDSDTTFVEPSSGKTGRFDRFLREEIKTLQRKTSDQSNHAAKTPKDSLHCQTLHSPPIPSPKNVNQDPEPDTGDSTWDAEEATIIVPASDAAEPPSTPAASKASFQIGVLDHSTKGRGSEDLLVEESDADDDIDSPVRNWAWDLGRFAFGKV